MSEANLRRALKRRDSDCFDYPQDARQDVDDRIERLLADPVAYVAEARERAIREIRRRNRL